MFPGCLSTELFIISSHIFNLILKYDYLYIFKILYIVDIHTLVDPM